MSKVVFLMETLLVLARMEVVRRHLGFDECFTVDPLGRSGGLALMWKYDINLNIHNYYLRHIGGCITC